MNMKKPKMFSFLIICVIFLSCFIAQFIHAAANYDDCLGNPEGNKKYIALTFDDGPHPKYTKKILDVLEEKKVAATFFIVGDRAELHTDILKRMRESGCEIGNHTYNHKDLSRKVKPETAISQIEKCNEVVFAATGEYPVVYRPPFGRINKENEKCICLRKVLWTVDSLDWKIKNKDKIIQKVVKNAKDGSIVLMHDFYETTLKACENSFYFL